MIEQPLSRPDETPSVERPHVALSMKVVALREMRLHRLALIAPRIAGQE